MFSGIRILASACFFIFMLYMHPFPCSADENQGKKIDELFVSKVTIHIEGSPENKIYYEKMARNVIFLKRGKQFSEKILKESIDALSLTKQFESIHVDSKEHNNKIELIFNLTLAQFIKAIRLKGNYPFFEKEILNFLNIYVGDKYDSSVLLKQVNMIAEFLKHKGFYAPGVYIDALQDERDGNYIITIRIVKGPYYKLRHISIDGNHSFPDIQLKAKIRQFRYSFIPGTTNRFVEWEFKKEIEDLTTFYRKKGYPEVAISYEVKRDKEEHDVDIRITIHEGDRYKVKFEGNKAFGKRKLKKDVTLFQRRKNVSFGIRKTMRNIKNRYISAGYQDAQITLKEDNDSKENKRILKFIIQEGVRTQIKDITITGNSHISKRKIRKQMLTTKPGPFKFIRKGNFVPGILADDIMAIQTLYKNYGYFDAQVKSSVNLNETESKVNINIQISEGEQVIVSSVVIKGLSVIPFEKAFKAIRLKQDQAFRESSIMEDENTLSALISEQGYPYVKVKGNFEINNNKAYVEYLVDEGIYVKMGEIYCSGNFQTKNRIIENEITIEPNEPFSLVEILDSQRNIQNMTIFNGSRFKSIGLKEKKDTINLFIEVEENKSRYVEFGAGYKSETGFGGRATIGNHNLFGTNKDAYIRYEGSEIGRLSELGILEPRFLGTHIEADLILKSELKEEYNKDHGTDTSSATLGFRRKLLKNITAGITTGLKQEHLYPTTLNSETVDTETDVWTITPSINYDTRDSFVRPKKGFLTIFSVDISTDEFNIYEEDVDSKYDFMKYNADFRFYITPYDKLTMAFRTMAGYIFPYNDDAWVNDSDLFYLGGTNTVRGFRENMLEYEEILEDDGEIKTKGQGGMISAIGSVEARIDLGANFELALFVDTGEIDNKDKEEKRHHFNLDYLRTSVGLGLRYHTPIGPLGIFYGKNLDPRPGEDTGQFHYALGYTF